MSSSQHPIALRLEQYVGGPTKLLATVMCLPLIDGIFPALVVAGALSSITGILEVGLLIFGGSATVAIILAEMGGTRGDKIRAVLAVGGLLLSLAVLEAALAPTIRQLLDLPRFERFAGLVILAIAAKTASARVGEWLPSPGVIISLGLLASVQPGGVALKIRTDPELIARAAAAAGVGIAFALTVAVFAPTLRTVVDIDRFRFGSAVALGILPLSLFGVLPPDAPFALAVLGVTALLAFDPGSDASEGVTSDGPDLEAELTATDGGHETQAVEGSQTFPSEDSGDVKATTDSETEADETDGQGQPQHVSNYLTTDGERAPWL